MVRSIALTGGVAAGKSTVSALLREFGYPVLDADVLAREVLLERGVQRKVEAIFDQDVFVSPGVLDREKVRKIVLANPAKRKELEQAIHPLVIRAFEARCRLLETLASDAWLFYEIPLLFESGRQKDFDAVLVITASEKVRLARMVATRGISLQEAEGFIAAQIPEERKAAEADFVIVNDSSREALDASVRESLQFLREKFSLLDS